MLETIGQISAYTLITGFALVILGIMANAGKNHKANRHHPWLNPNTGVNEIPRYSGFVADEHGEPISRTHAAARPELAELVGVIMNAPRPSRTYAPTQPKVVVPVEVPRAYMLPTPPSLHPSPTPQTFVPVEIDGDGVPTWWRKLPDVGSNWKMPTLYLSPRHADVARDGTNEQSLDAHNEYLGRHYTEKAVGSSGQRALTENTGQLDMSKLYALLDSELVPA